jgi:hypothetical protein
MKIDWTELQKGFEREKIKTASAPTPAVGAVGSAVSKVPFLTKILDKVKGWLPSAGKAATGVAAATTAGIVGKGAYDAGKNLLGGAQDTLLGLTNHLPSLLAGAQGQQSVQTQGPGYVLPPQRGGVSSWKNPLSVYEPTRPVFKRAGIMGDVTNIAKNRIANSVINEVTKTNPLGGDISEHAPAQPSEKEIQLVSEFPEIKEMLKNEENKAYLERLLKD